MEVPIIALDSRLLKSISAVAALINTGNSPRGEELSLHDQARLDEVREAIRSWIASGSVPDPRAVEVLNRAGSAVPMRIVIDHEGGVRIDPLSTFPADRILGDALAAVFDAVRSGLWPRLKICGNPDCGWVFFDRSRNRSRVWCEMAECGNRAKARRYRAKRSRAGA